MQNKREEEERVRQQKLLKAEAKKKRKEFLKKTSVHSVVLEIDANRFPPPTVHSDSESLNELQDRGVRSLAIDARSISSPQRKPSLVMRLSEPNSAQPKSPPSRSKTQKNLVK